ncbi:MAG: NAD(P)/FAD-dependent oxidoreductase [Planctomycetales bacterium]
MDHCDVVIVGGGPAGSTCARELVQGGRDVILLDKAAFPRDKVCAGWITPAVVDELQLELVDYQQGRVLQPITGFRTSVRGGPELLTSFGRTVSFGIRRCEFDHYLLARCGARLRLGEALESLRRDGERWIVNEAVSASLLIGAGGHFCPVARQVSKPGSQSETVVLAQEIELTLRESDVSSCRVEPMTPELYFCEDLRGYAWCFRKGTVLNIGLGREGETRLSAEVERFRQWLSAQGRIPPGELPRFHGHAYRLYLGEPRTLTTDRALLIGDAAGLAYPQSGEGIRPAVESGLLAARAILDSSTGDPSRLVTRYQQCLRERLGTPRPAAKGRAGWLPSAWRRFAAHRLMRNRWFTRHVLLERWFLHARHPPLQFSRQAVATRHDN